MSQDKIPLPKDVLPKLKRLEDESEKAHAAFLLWVELGPDRSLGGVCRALNKGRGYSTQIQRWQKEHDWHRRIAPVLTYEAIKGGRPLPTGTVAEQAKLVEDLASQVATTMDSVQGKMSGLEASATRAHGLARTVEERLDLLNDRLASIEEYEERLRRVSEHQLKIAEDLLRYLADRVVDVATKPNLSPKEFATLLNAAERAAGAARVNISETEGVTLYISRILKELEEAGPPADDAAKPLH